MYVLKSRFPKMFWSEEKKIIEFLEEATRYLTRESAQAKLDFFGAIDEDQSLYWSILTLAEAQELTGFTVGVEKEKAGEQDIRPLQKV